ncbi:MAG: ATP-binding protein [Myxococcota bacterium]|nr:ATP-binding protein [Myxococcota bacterium]
MQETGKRGGSSEILGMLDRVFLLVDQEGRVEATGGSLDLLAHPLDQAVGLHLTVLLGIDEDRLSLMLGFLEENRRWSTRTSLDGQPVELDLRRRSGGGALMEIIPIVGAALQESAGLRALGEVMGAMGVGIWTHDHINQRVWYSAKAREMLLLDSDTPISATSILPMLSAEERHALAEVVSEAIPKGRPYRQELLLRLPDGGELPALLFGEVEFDALGRPYRTVGGLQDLREVQAQQVRVSALRAELNALQRDRGLGLMTAGAVHDFNNLLTAMTGCLSLIEEAPELSEETRVDVAQLGQATLRAGGLSRKLMNYARQPQSPKEGAELVSALEEILHFLKRAMPPGITLDWSLESDALFVKLDLGSLHQVLTNLVLNAKHAIDAQGEIRVRAWEDEDEDIAYIEVSDSGCGMSPEVLEQAFRPFFTTRGEGEGSGLGLASCQNLVHEVGGEISARSVLGEGSVFTVRLPLDEEWALERSLPYEELESGAGRRVLLLSPELLLRRVTTRLLEAAGYAVDPVDSLPQAFEALSARPVDLAVVDSVPGGPNLAVQLKSVHPELRILRVGATEPRESESRSLPKPYTREQLLLAVQEAVEGG